MEIKRFTENPINEILESIKRIFPTKAFKNSDSESVSRIIQMCMRERHYSVFTHVVATIEFACSLKVIHELCNNNLHVTPKAHVVEKEDYSIEFIFPEEIKDGDLNVLFTNYIKYVSKTIRQMVEKDKKVDLTYLLPGCTKMDVLITASFLEWMKIIRLSYFSRTSSELRVICSLLYDKLSHICPEVFNKNILRMKIEME